jgi:uncharacterized iron-regulated membrane protein
VLIQRSGFVILHRWAGLVIAGFLFISGLTGAIISWDHELDDLLNPHLMEATSKGEARPSLEFVEEIEARHPQVRVSFVPLLIEPGESLGFSVSPRVNPETGKLFEPGYNQIFIYPVTGEELGTRYWGAPWPITSENLISFLYVLHYSLHIPEMWGIDRWGIWLLGIIAIIWTLDCFVGFYLTLPSKKRQTANAGNLKHRDNADTGRSEKTWWQRWQIAWRVRWLGGPYKVNFDLHRAGGLWTWIFLFIIAFTSFSLNLYREVFFPMMSTVSQVTPGPFDIRPMAELNQPIVPKIGFDAIIQRAATEARNQGWQEPVGNIFYSQEFGVYGVGFFHAGEDHGAAGVGPAQIYYDGVDGSYLGDKEPWKGTAADIFVQMQFPMHSGRILGLPGRILISIMGLVVAMLSVTGVYVWWRKHKARSKYVVYQYVGNASKSRDMKTI